MVIDGVKLTLQRKVSIVVVTLGAGFLAVDRFVLEPAGLGPAPAAGAEPVIKPARSGGGASVQTVADRLDTLRANAAVAIDGFAAPTGWLPPVPVEATAKPSVADKTPAPTLTGVFPRAEGGAAQAIINKKRVKEGEVVDGWRVVKIRGTSSGEKPGVLVARGDRTVELAIEPVLANARTTVTPRAERVQSAAASEGNGR